jgi:hypothetical protein
MARVLKKKSPLAGGRYDERTSRKRVSVRNEIVASSPLKN